MAGFLAHEVPSRRAALWGGEDVATTVGLGFHTSREICELARSRNLEEEIPLGER